MVSDGNHGLQGKRKRERATGFLSLVDSFLIDDDSKVGKLPLAERHQRAIALMMPVYDIARIERDADIKKAAAVTEYYLLGNTRNMVAKSAETQLPNDRVMNEMVGQVALIAAQLHEGRKIVGNGTEPAGTSMVVGERDNMTPTTLAETIRSLDIKDGMKAALLVLFDQVETAKLDPKRVGVAKSEARRSISRRVGRRYAEFPLLMQLAGDDRNGRPARDFSEVVDQRIHSRIHLDGLQDSPVDDASARRAVYNAFSGELLLLLDSPAPKLYDYS